ncbi:Protein of unknown function [Streptomyces sp. 1222.5]|uniref:DUF2637 domain-containing protein n=1 Tax=unclassified Streptomyces TaxID=2593676 RepID=UPI000896D831|nr:MULTISPECIES: DUF2637 domain-containing protein [unclassified Streptomyces]PKW08722.1 uncharacterized protein DUF2637 [Streptomyces sp. 5112.2]SEC55360.1 Protein of unknown function [Streptomyces sp. 1222.5]
MNRKGRIALVLALVAVVGMAFRVSWNALRDIAGAVGADGTAATLYPFVVDGLMALALVATLVLVDRDRSFALKVLGTYTGASLVLNYVHGLVPALHGRGVEWGRLADWDPANWALVLLATSLPVGSIYFGSDLVAKVLDHRPALDPTPIANAEESTKTEMIRSTADLPESAPAPVAVPVVRVPDPVPADAGKSIPVLKPVSVLPTPVGQAPTRSIARPSMAAESTRPRRTTYRVPDAAKAPRTRRTADQLMSEARTLTADWPVAQITGEGIRRALRTSPVNARKLRDALLAERAA